MPWKPWEQFPSLTLSPEKKDMASFLLSRLMVTVVLYLGASGRAQEPTYL